MFTPDDIDAVAEDFGLHLEGAEHLVDIYRPAKTRDAIGGDKLDWSTPLYTDVPCVINATSLQAQAQIREVASIKSGEQVYEVLFRQGQDIDTGDRLRQSDVDGYYEIRHVPEGETFQIIRHTVAVRHDRLSKA